MPRGWLQTNRLVLAGYLLLWPPILLLLTRRSYEPQVFGWWTYRVFGLVLASLAVMLACTWLVVRLLRSRGGLPRLEMATRRVRRRPLLLVPLVLLPPVVWLGLVAYLARLGVQLDGRLLVGLADLASLILVWEVGLAFVGREHRQQRELLLKWVLAGFGVGVALLMVEIGGNALRVAPYVDWHVNPKRLDVPFRTRDFDTRVVTNLQGLREPVEIERAHDGVFRIVAVGDSFTFGWGVEHDEAYVKVAESILREKYGWTQVEIINMGRPGAAPHDYLRFVRRYAGQLDPDVVLIGFLVGDDCPVVSPASLQSDDEVRRAHARFEELARVNRVHGWLSLSCTARLVQSALLPRLRSGAGLSSAGVRGPIFGEPNPLDPAAVEAEIRQQADPDRARQRYEYLQQRGWVDRGLRWEVNPWLVRAVVLRPGGAADSLAVRPETKEFMPYEWKLCEALLVDMQQASRELDAELVVVGLPNAHLVSQRWVDFLATEWRCEVFEEMTRSRHVNDWLAAFCRRQDILCVDPLDTFRARRDAGHDLYFETDDHITAEGQQLVGEVLAEALFRKFGPASGTTPSGMPAGSEPGGTDL